MDNERLRSVGCQGSSDFVDPMKIFVGNLPYDASEIDLYNALGNYWNVNREGIDGRVQSVKIVRDWKTGQSKGYLFYSSTTPWPLRWQ